MDQTFRYPRTLLFKLASPAIVFTVILILILAVAPSRGPVPLGPLAFLVVLFVLTILFFGYPIFVNPYRLLLSERGIEASYFFRKRVILPWQGVRSVAEKPHHIFDRTGTKVIIRGARWRERIVVTDDLKEWDRFVELVAKSLPKQFSERRRIDPSVLTK